MKVMRHRGWVLIMVMCCKLRAETREGGGRGCDVVFPTFGST